MIICVTGGTGYVGSKLIKKLLIKGYNVRYLSRNDSRPLIIGAERFIGDLRCPKTNLSEFVKDCEIIYNCAGEKTIEAHMYSLHVLGTINLVNVIIKEQSRSRRKIRWVQLSSCGLYGNPKNLVNIDRVVKEDSPIILESEYEDTKFKSDEILIKRFINSNIEYCILRPSNIVSHDDLGRTLSRLIILIKYKCFFYIGKPGAIVTYIHVNDVVDALMLAGTDIKASNQIYILSRDCTIEELAAAISSSMNIIGQYFRIPEKYFNIIYDFIKFLMFGFKVLPKKDFFISRTRYCSKKIEDQLGFKCSQEIINFIKNSITNNLN